jgi:RNA polymerase sigma-70 factor (ECF subfamily)
MRNSTKSEQQKPNLPELVQKSLDGDVSAFGSLMDSQKQYAYAVAYRLLHDEENSKDVVQEAFIRVWNNLRKYRKEIKFTTWLYKIVVNLCYDKIKMNSRQRNIFGYTGNIFGNNDVADSRDFHSDVEKSDLCDHVISESKNLPLKEYLVFHLRDVLDFSIEEIAEMVGMSTASVKTNLCYARRRIRIAVNRLQESEQL